MTGFSTSWLDCREAADHRSRNLSLAGALSRHFRARREIAIADLGGGTGSNLRATAPLLPATQHWTLIDADEGLLDAAPARLAAWADDAAWEGATLALAKGEKRIRVELRRADLTHDLEPALGDADLVAASALFDLVSAAFIDGLAAALAERRSAFYATLTYDGRLCWEPESDADAPLRDAFNAHQRGDKGFGPAAGPDASAALVAALSAADYAVAQGDSAWRLGPGDEALIAELAAGVAAAARATGIDAGLVDRWRALTRRTALVGHADIFAFPTRVG